MFVGKQQALPLLCCIVALDYSCVLRHAAGASDAFGVMFSTYVSTRHVLETLLFVTASSLFCDKNHCHPQEHIAVGLCCVSRSAPSAT